MLLKSLIEIPQTRDNINVFNGLNATNECQENEFVDMGNITTLDYPFLANRRPESYLDIFEDAILGTISIDDTLYVVVQNGIYKKTKTRTTLYEHYFSSSKKEIARLGSYICIFPDAVCFQTIKNTFESIGNIRNISTVTFSLANARGEAITTHDEAYYKENKPQTGDYLMTQSNGSSVLKEYNGVSQTWVNVYTTYIQASGTGIGTGFKKGDGVSITIDNLRDWDEGKQIFPDTTDNVNYSRDVILQSVEKDKITFTGIISQTKVWYSGAMVLRAVPQIKYLTEANNRIWGCNSSGTEIYACALGDPLNWNCFEGISTDSWAMTVGSEGKFTGACTYMGYPIFWKENSLIKIAISSIGAHQSKETVCRGVADGCNKSLAVVNEILYYKSKSAICSYDGSLPTTISKKLGDLTNFTECEAGEDKNLYQISGYQGKYVTYIFDTQKGIFVKGDNAKFSNYVTHMGELYAVKDGKDVVCFGECALPVKSKETDVISFVQSKPIDYYTPNNKYVNSFIIKTTMELGSEIQVYMMYDNDVKWQRVAKIKARGTKVTSIPIRPRRCGHFAYRIEGTGNYKIHQIVKTYSEGSDV